ncbi:unnamed protein product [Meganyctiphanes norvegica]|uniref:Uncharacterized protein n=1 Tax=Meganyctiphanes norvegica TaxID=48144 RepID=A0AAV2RU82_MEGNR
MMKGLRGGIDKWGESNSTSTHLNSIKDHVDPEDDVQDSDLDVDLAHFEHNFAIENNENFENSNLYNDSPQITHNPLAFLFNKSSEINTSKQKPEHEVPSSNWSFKPQQSNSRLEQNTPTDLLSSLNTKSQQLNARLQQNTSTDFLSSLHNTVPLEQSSNIKINPLIGLSSLAQNETQNSQSKPSSNWLLNPKHKLSQRESSISGHDLPENIYIQNPLGEDYSSYDNDHLNYYEENVIYNENFTAENQDDYEQMYHDNEYSNNYGDHENCFEYEYQSERMLGDNQYFNHDKGTYFFKREDGAFNHYFNEISNDKLRSPSIAEYKDLSFNYNNYNHYESVKIYRKTRRQRNQESTLSQQRSSLTNGNISDSSYEVKHKTIPPHSFHSNCDEIYSLPDTTSSKHFKLSIDTIPPSDSLPPLPEPDYDLSDATFYIPPPDY